MSKPPCGSSTPLTDANWRPGVIFHDSSCAYTWLALATERPIVVCLKQPFGKPSWQALDVGNPLPLSMYHVQEAQ